jgi:hypothetical protein
MVSDETFFAWMDGELDRAEAARVEAAVAADPRLTALADEHRAMQSRLQGAFDRLLDAPVPDATLEAVRNPARADVIDLAEAKKRRERRNWPSVAQWGSIAATLVIGVVIGTALPDRRNAGPVEAQGGKLYAAASLGKALDAQLASAPAGETRIGLTFRDHAGAICRSFANPASSGLACRENGRWQLRGLFATPQGQSTDYRMAAGMDPALAALVESSMAGEPFDAAQEQTAREHRWK